MAETPSPQPESPGSPIPFGPTQVESCKKMEKTIDTVDHISLLPDFIVHKILSNLLDSPEALVRMSILSNDWFSLTASFPIIHFRKHDIIQVLCRRKDFEWDDNYPRDAFFKNVAYTTSRFCKQNVSAHTLTVITDLLEPIEVEVMKDCLESILKKGVQEFKIIIDFEKNRPMLRLPNTLLSAYALTSLTIYGCKLPSSLMFDVVMFKSLKLLSMTLVPIDEGVIEYLTASCPLLEEIFVRYCYGFTTFCVYRHHSLRKVQIFSESGLERINIEAPNLCYFALENNEENVVCMNMASCNKLTTFCYAGSPLKSFSDFLSNFPIIENLCIGLTYPQNNMKLSNHSLRRFELCSSINTIFFQKLREFLGKSNIFKVLDLSLEPGFIDVELLMGIKSPPYELEHVEVELLVYPLNSSNSSSIYPPILDAVLWCCRPRSLTLDLDSLYLSPYTDRCHVVQNVYETLLQQENEGQIKIQFVLLYRSGREQQFSDFNSLLEALSFDQPIRGITFTKEQVVQEAECSSM